MEKINKKIVIKDNLGRKIVGIFSTTSNCSNLPMIVLCHGFTSSKNSRTSIQLEKELNKKNIATFRFDFFGHGESDGKFENITISKAVDNIFCVINHWHELGFIDIGLFGSSFGGIASIIASSYNPFVKLLVLKAPVSDYYEVTNIRKSVHDIKNWNTNGFTMHLNSLGDEKKLNYSFYSDFKNHDVYCLAKNIDVPTLIVHGDRDKTVPVSQSKKLAGFIKDCQLNIIAGADHKFSESDDFINMIKVVTKYIGKHISSTIHDEKFKKIWNLATPYLKKGLKKDFLLHTQGVVRAVELIAPKEGGDLDLLIPAAILHDVGWAGVPKEYQITKSKQKQTEGLKMHIELAPKIIKKILEQLNYRESKISQIIDIVQSHKFCVPTKINQKILIDADHTSDSFKEQFESDVVSYKTAAPELHQFRMTESDFYTKTARELFLSQMKVRREEFIEIFHQKHCSFNHTI